MGVVSDTSPLSNLAIIGRLGLLREEFGAVLIPPAVENELSRLANPTAVSSLRGAIAQNWIRVTPLSKSVPERLRLTLDRGEAEALALALETKAQLVLLDESEARMEAKQLGLAHTGVLGILREARRGGQISSLRDEIIRLRNEARFFVHPALEKEMLISVGES